MYLGIFLHKKNQFNLVNCLHPELINNQALYLKKNDCILGFKNC